MAADPAEPPCRAALPLPGRAPERRLWLATGQVQGVGFRPFVYRLALANGLAGFVLNDERGVVIEAEGPAENLARFDRQIRGQPPPLARLDRLLSRRLGPAAGEQAFRILPSAAGASPRAAVTADAATCPDCLRELLDPADRRHRHPLITCTHCGPRYTIVRGVPYDRSRTTMAAFPMCGRCRGEYEDPADRRFHAQPIACRDCGPRLELVDPAGRRFGAGEGAGGEADPVDDAARLLAGGRIVAVKGLGGYHLATDASDEAAVARLRRLKLRDAKPFAIMVRSVAAARRFAALSPAAVVELAGPAAPIVLAPCRRGAPVAAAVAPGSHRLGVMVPCTPLQHLLFAALPPAIEALVMTSGNPGGEPLVRDDEEAVARLGGMCDALLRHDRPIERRVDDSVSIDFAGGPLLPVRRARGYVPAALELPEPLREGAEDGLCLGGELKGAVAVVREGRVVLGQHLGDLTNPLAFAEMTRCAGDLCDLFGVEPRWIAHDLHPGYLSTAHARALAQRLGVPLVGVQHHHAHAAAALAEHGRHGPALALVADGAGWGPDGTVWGGELLLAGLQGCRRLARLRPLVLPGGDAAAVDLRRCGLSLLRRAAGPGFARHPAAARLVPDAEERRFLCRMISRRIRCLESSSLGRLFDGVAALLGLCLRNEHEAQAACRLEAEAFAWRGGELPRPCPTVAAAPSAGRRPVEIDLGPCVLDLLRRQEAGEAGPPLAARFHARLADALAAEALAAAERTGLRTLVLSGGSFCNELLTRRLTELLEGRGLSVLRHRLVPPNDGGLAYGQAAVAVALRAAGKGA